MADVALWLINSKFETESANRQWHRFYGVDPLELPYKVKNIEETVHKDDLEGFFDFMAAYDTRTSFEMTVRQLRCDGKWRIRYSVGEPIWRQDRYVGMTGSSFDITDGFTEEVLEDDRVIARRIGRNLQKIRNVRGFTQAELAAVLNVTQSNISQFETGRINPTVAQLNSFAHILKVPIGVFFDEN